MHRRLPDGAGEFLGGLAEQHDGVARVREGGGDAGGHVVDHAEHADGGSGQDGHVGRLVVERHVAAGDRDAQLTAAVDQAEHGLGERPHHLRVLRGSEVEAVGDGDGLGAGDGDVAVGLGQRVLRTEVGVEVGEPRVRVQRERDAQAGLLVDAQHAGVLRLREHGVAAHVAVVLLGHPCLVGHVAVREHLEQCGPEALGAVVAVEALRAVGLHVVEPARPVVRTVVDGAVVGDRLRVHVDDGLAVPLDDEAVAVDDLANHRGLHVPLAADLQEALDVGGLHHRHHALLRLAHEDLLRREVGVAQGHEVEVDEHAAVAGRRELGGGTRDAGGAEILDAADDARLEQFEGALDEELLHEGVAHLHAGALGGAVLVEGLGREDGGAADAVAAGGRTEQDHLVADARRVGEVEVVVAQHADAQGVDERVAEVGLVELHLAADVRQSKAVAVPADPRHDSGQHPLRVICVKRAETQRVHDADGARAHGEDVAHDAADAGGRTLVGLDERRVVVGFGLEGHGVALADVDDAGVLADPGQQRPPRRLLRERAELPEVHLRGLVGAVLGPHDRVHGKFRGGRAAAQDLADHLVLVILDAERCVRLLDVRGLEGLGNGVYHAAQSTVHGPTSGCADQPPPFSPLWVKACVDSVNSLHKRTMFRNDGQFRHDEAVVKSHTRRV